jgi:hypothetical protein
LVFITATCFKGYVCIQRIATTCASLAGIPEKITCFIFPIAACVIKTTECTCGTKGGIALSTCIYNFNTHYIGAIGGNFRIDGGTFSILCNPINSPYIFNTTNGAFKSYRSI